MLHRYPLETYSKTHSKIKMWSKIFNPDPCKPLVPCYIMHNGSAWFLVGPPDFKSGVLSAEGGGWVRFPCTSANDLRGWRSKFLASFFLRGAGRRRHRSIALVCRTTRLARHFSRRRGAANWVSRPFPGIDATGQGLGVFVPLLQ